MTSLSKRLRAAQGPLFAAACWVVFAAIVIIATRPTVAIGALLLAVGPLLGGVLQSGRQHRAVLRQIRQRTSDESTREILKAVAGQTADLDKRLRAIDERAESSAAVLKQVREEAAQGAATARVAVRRASESAFVAQSSLDALGPIRDQLKVIGSHAFEADQETIRSVRRWITAGASTTYKQMEALTTLYATLPVTQSMPPTRGWAASPDLLLALVDLVRRERPHLIIECGSGTSTLWFARALRHYDVDGRIVSLDHDPHYGEQTRLMLKDHGVADYVDVVDAPLVDVDVHGTTWRWYDPEAWSGVQGCDLLFVDGPPAATGEMARYPALPLLEKKMSERGIVVLDDVIRADEQKIIDEWCAEMPGWSATKLDLEKGGVVLRRGADEATASP